jgi:hypothetical protein
MKDRQLILLQQAPEARVFLRGITFDDGQVPGSVSVSQFLDDVLISRVWSGNGSPPGMK